MLLDFQTLLLVVPIMLFAGLVHGTLGLGFPMVATPLIAVFYDVKLAILITLLPTAVVNIESIYSYGSFQSAAKKYYPLAVSCVVGSIVGAYVLSESDPSVFRLLLALLILLFLWINRYNVLPREWCNSNPTIALVTVGVVGGFSAGTTNVMVAVLLIYFLSMGVARREMVSAMNFCFLVGKVSQISVFYLTGLLSAGLLLKTVPLALCGFAAVKVGQRIGQRIPQEKYRQILHLLLIGLAVVLIAQFLRGY